MRIVVILLILIVFPLMGWFGYVVVKNKKVGFFDALLTTSEQNAEAIVNEEVDNFLQALRDALKRQGKKPCGHCYSMMEPGDPRIPLEHFNSSKYFVYKGKTK